MFNQKIIGKFGNNDISKYLLKEINCNFQKELKKIDYNKNKWKLTFSDGDNKFYDNLILSLEIGARYTFSDKIDGNSVISDDLNYNFGNINNKDWYMFSNFSLTYTFGRNPCYCNIGQ